MQRNVDSLQCICEEGLEFIGEPDLIFVVEDIDQFGQMTLSIAFGGASNAPAVPLLHAMSWDAVFTGEAAKVDLSGGDWRLAFLDIEDVAGQFILSALHAQNAVCEVRRVEDGRYLQLTLRIGERRFDTELVSVESLNEIFRFV